MFLNIISLSRRIILKRFRIDSGSLNILYTRFPGVVPKVSIFCTNCGTGGIILNPPRRQTPPPRKKSWILENIKTPEKKIAREAREKNWAFFRLFFKAKWSKNSQSMDNIKTPSRTFWEIWKILKPREKKSEISSLRGGYYYPPGSHW